MEDQAIGLFVDPEGEVSGVTGYAMLNNEAQLVFHRSLESLSLKNYHFTDANFELIVEVMEETDIDQPHCTSLELWECEFDLEDSRLVDPIELIKPLKAFTRYHPNPYTRILLRTLTYLASTSKLFLHAIKSNLESLTLDYDIWYANKDKDTLIKYPCQLDSFVALKQLRISPEYFAWQKELLEVVNVPMPEKLEILALDPFYLTGTDDERVRYDDILTDFVENGKRRCLTPRRSPFTGSRKSRFRKG